MSIVLRSAETQIAHCVALLFLVAVPITAQTAKSTECTVRFVATWSAATHPAAFPPSPHFSGLIGGSHNDQQSFWEAGGSASLGIQEMAEGGSKGSLQTEVEEAMSVGTTHSVLSGGGIGLSPGEVDMTFTLYDSHPLVTLVSMIAPSPDWFVGVSSLPLHDASGWLSPSVPLIGWDAGTDSGPTYTSANLETIPRGLIAQITSGPLQGAPPLGTFEFRCALFRDGFESEGTDLWSSTLGGL